MTDVAAQNTIDLDQGLSICYLVMLFTVTPVVSKHGVIPGKKVASYAILLMSVFSSVAKS